MLPNPQETSDFIAFTEEILKENLIFLCSVQIPQTDESNNTWDKNVTYIKEK